MKYRLPCTNCDSFLTVEPKDAGRQLPCPACQVPQKLPSMQNIRRLEPDTDSAGAKSREKSWSVLQGASFGLGLICLVISAIGLYNYYPKYQAAKVEYETLLAENNGTLPDYTDITPVVKVFDSMPITKLWPAWRDALKIQPDRWMPAPPRIIEDNMANTEFAMISYGCLGLFGLVAMAVSMFLP